MHSCLLYPRQQGLTQIVCHRMGDPSQTTYCREHLLGSQAVSVALRLFHLGYRATDETTVILLETVEFRQGIARNERVRIAGIDTREERIDRIIDE